jgi:hypothetical protein
MKNENNIEHCQRCGRSYNCTTTDASLIFFFCSGNCERTFAQAITAYWINKQPSTPGKEKQPPCTPKH